MTDFTVYFSLMVVATMLFIRLHYQEKRISRLEERVWQLRESIMEKT